MLFLFLQIELALIFSASSAVKIFSNKHLYCIFSGNANSQIYVFDFHPVHPGNMYLFNRDHCDRHRPGCRYRHPPRRPGILLHEEKEVLSVSVQCRTNEIILSTATPSKPSTSPSWWMSPELCHTSTAQMD